MWERSTLVCQIVFGELQTDEIDIRFIYLEKYQMLKMFSTAKKERIDTFFLCSSEVPRIQIGRGHVPVNVHQVKQAQVMKWPD